MLKCLSFSSVEPFRQEAETGDDESGASEMGAEQKMSSDKTGSDFMTSATSFIKGCVLRSLSDDGYGHVNFRCICNFRFY